MGDFKCPKCIHKLVCKDELLNQPINKPCTHYIAEEKFTSTNRDAIIAKAVEAWNEWNDTADQFPSHELIDAMNELSEFEHSARA